MKRLRWCAMPLALLVFSIMSSSGVARAAGDPILFVQPPAVSVRPGDEMTMQGLQFGSSLTVTLHIIGSRVNVHLGETQTNEAGNFTAQFRLPDSTAEGTYQIQATDTSGKNAFMRLTVSNNPTTNSVTQGMTLPARTRPIGQIIGLLAFFAVVAAFGLLLAWTTHRKVRRA